MNSLPDKKIDLKFCTRFLIIYTAVTHWIIEIPQEYTATVTIQSFGLEGCKTTLQYILLYSQSINSLWNWTQYFLCFHILFCLTKYNKILKFARQYQQQHIKSKNFIILICKSVKNQTHHRTGEIDGVQKYTEYQDLNSTKNLQYFKKWSHLVLFKKVPQCCTKMFIQNGMHINIYVWNTQKITHSIYMSTILGVIVAFMLSNH